MSFFDKSDSELNDLRRRTCCSAMRKDYGEYKGFALPNKFTKMQQRILDMEVYDDDIWIVTYPKCGKY